MPHDNERNRKTSEGRWLWRAILVHFGWSSLWIFAWELVPWIPNAQFDLQDQLSSKVCAKFKVPREIQVRYALSIKLSQISWQGNRAKEVVENSIARNMLDSDDSWICCTRDKLSDESNSRFC